MQRIFAAAIITLVGVSIVAADEFFGTITKVDGNKLAITKFKRGEKTGEAVTLTAREDVKVIKGKFNRETKKFEAGEPVAGGLKSELFAKEVRGRIVTNDANEVTEIRVLDGGRRKKKDN